MGLENLKSALGNILYNTNSSDIQYPQDPSGLHAPPHEDVEGVDASSNIYPYNYTTLDINGIPETFEPSSILDATSIPFEVIESFESPLLFDIYNNLETPPTESDDIRFSWGFSSLFAPPKMTLQVATDGAKASLYYINTPTGVTFGASGAFSKFGKLSDLAQKTGIKLPVYDWDVPIFTAPPLTYPNTVEEMFNGSKNLVDSFVDGEGDSRRTRGIAFQVLGKQNKAGLKPDFSFQDTVTRETVNILGLDIPMPFTIDTNDEYIDKQMKAWKDSGGLFPKEPKKETKKENEMIQETAKSIGNDDLVGFGNEIKKPPQKKNFFQKGRSFISGIGDKISDIGDSLKSGAKDIASKLNPFPDLNLPKIKFKSAISLNKSDFGGQAKFLENQPRALSRDIPIKTMNPFGEDMGIEAQLVSSNIADREYVLNDTSTPYADIGKKAYGGIRNISPTAFYPNQSMDEKTGGDKMTLAPMLSGPDLSVFDTTGGKGFIESEDNGMPLYFKDLRDDTYLVFRGYVEGLTESVSPSWASTTYIGRSEPTHIYENAERTINFNLKLVAQTAVELDAIYSKLNRLTSLAYPKYEDDSLLQSGTEVVEVQEPNGVAQVPVYKSRMKPPLTRLRIGELFGNSLDKKRDGQLGFIGSLSYEWPDEATWEYRKGQRVPKVINITIEYKVMHDEVPNMNTSNFYGYYPSLLNKKMDKTSVLAKAGEIASLGANFEEDDDFFD